MGSLSSHSLSWNLESNLPISKVYLKSFSCFVNREPLFLGRIGSRAGGSHCRLGRSVSMTSIDDLSNIRAIIGWGLLTL
jgi:hypothetical protein